MLNLLLTMPAYRFFRVPHKDRDEAVWHFFDILRVLDNIRRVVDFAETAWLTLPDNRSEDLREIYEKLILTNIENEKVAKKMRQYEFMVFPRAATEGLYERLTLIIGEYSRFFDIGARPAAPQQRQPLG